MSLFLIPAIGQCWMSEAEPELGLGFIVEVSNQQLSVRFPETQQTRCYGKRSAPLKRIHWQVGDRLKSRDGASFVVEEIQERAGIFWYLGSGLEFSESEISADTKPQGPQGRLISGHWDSPVTFDLRRRTLEYWSRSMSSPVRGLLGPRLEWIPHQVHVVSEVTERALPRVLLADEVGLGKTIEAGWIAHHLLVTGKIKRVLILAPKSMVNQWFVEMLRRFNFTFSVPESQPDFEAFSESDFIDDEKLIVSFDAFEDKDACIGLMSAPWDLIIVDEAHRIAWYPDEPSHEYLVLKELSEKARGLLLLTATPEQLGIEGHFGRLHLLDPQRFPSFEKFVKEHDRYQEVVRVTEILLSEKNLSDAQIKKIQSLLSGKVSSEILSDPNQKRYRDQILRAFIDFYGTGRVYFRNARKVVEAESYRFPKRVLKTTVLEGESRDDVYKKRIAWLHSLLEEYRSDKFLLICSSKKKVEKLEAALAEVTRVNTATFHEGQSLLVRDRNAAYFADPEGARLLLSSEIGSEGRNFQFARHLILWDLPEDPDILEQRIGRLDRIGQQKEFFIHLPYWGGSGEEALFRWYHEVFNAFHIPSTGATAIHDEFVERLAGIIENFDSKNLSQLIDEAKTKYLETRKVLEQGRDRLIEMNSFQPQLALNKVKQLAGEEKADELQDYMQSIFSWVGVNEEDLDEDSFFVEPGDSMFIPVFPGLPDQGIQITYKRKKALEREDLSLLSWDHPMVRQVMETLVAQEFGNVSIARWKNIGTKMPALMECYFVVQAPLSSEWFGEEFFPPHPLRVVVDLQGRELSQTWSVDRVSNELSRLKVRPEDWLRSGLRDRIQGLVDHASKYAKKPGTDYRDQATRKMRNHIETEILRLESLGKKNGLVSNRELKWWENRRNQLEAIYAKSDIRLDSIRVVF